MARRLMVWGNAITTKSLLKLRELSVVSLVERSSHWFRFADGSEFVSNCFWWEAWWCSSWSENDLAHVPRLLLI